MEAELQDNTVFVSYEEVKQTVGPKKVLKIFLLDKAGNRALAATGEDLGDAHYHYRSSRLFKKYGSLDCHNRKELTIWLEMVISESGGRRDGAHLGADEQNPEGVYFTSHRNERAHYPDGRRCNRWYLIDQHGEAHLAVIGIERDTKDGHYNYNAEEPFAALAPLHCSNQAGVYKWLEKMITHHACGGDGPAMSAAHSAASGASGALSGEGGGRKPPMVINLSALRSARKSAAALNSLEHAVVVEGIVRQSKPKPPKPASTPAPAPLSTTAKQKSVGIVQQMQIKKARKLQEDIRAEEEKLQTTHLTRLRRAAAAEVAGDTAAKATTLGWLHGALGDEEQEHLDHWLALLTAVLDLQQKAETTEAADGNKEQQQQQQQQGQEPAAGGTAAAGGGSSGETDIMVWIQQPANRRHHLRVILECLKELGAADLPARVLLKRKVIQLVQRCLSWPHKAVTSMAQHMLDRWSWQLAGHMHVLSCPAYMEDHSAALEEEIMCGMVPLPQLPKHKQALLNTPIPKLPAATPYQTPAPPAKQAAYQQQQQLLLQAPASAPAVMNPALSAAAAGTGMMQYPALAAPAPGYGSAAGYSTGYTAAMAGGTIPVAQTPGYYTPMAANPAAAGLQGMKASTGGLKGTGARGLPGLAAAAAAGGGPAGRFLYSATPGAAGAAAGRPQGMSAMGGMTAAGTGLMGQQGPGYVDPAAYANAAGTGNMAGWGAGGAGGGMYGAGGAAGSSTDLAAMAAAAAGDASAAGLDAAQRAQQAAQQQQMAMYAMQQQQLRMGMVNARMMGQQQTPAGAMQVQYAHPAAVQAQQQQAGMAAAAAPINPQHQQQQLLAQQWQQQQMMNWQQQQQQQQQQHHMQAVWAGHSGGYGGGTVSAGGASDAAAASGGQVPQHSGSQGFG